MPSPRRKRLSVIGSTMILVIVPSCIYYLYFVQSQNGYFTNRNFRVLADIGSQMKMKIDNVGTSLSNLVKGTNQPKKEIVSTPKKVDTNQTNSKPQQTKLGTKAATQAEPAARLKGAIELIDKSGTNLKYEPAYRPQQQRQGLSPSQTAILLKRIFPARPVNANRSVANANTTVRNSNSPRLPRAANSNTAIPDSRPTPTSPVANANRSISNTSPAIPPTNTAAANNSRSLRWTRRPSSNAGEGQAGEPPITLSVRAEKGSFRLHFASAGSVLANSEIHELFDPFVERYVIDVLNETQNRLFDAVLVAEQQDGRVIFEHGQSGLKTVSLDSLQSDNGGKLELNLANQASSLADVRLAGGSYKLFVQPVRLTLSASDDDKKQGVRWVVCGLTRTDHFRDQTFAISYTLVIIFVFIALLAALSWPLLKLQLMGPKDRLRRSDFALTSFSALVGTALLTFLLADLYMYVNLGRALDVELQQLASAIRSNFREETGSALAQLSRLNNMVTEVASKQRSAAFTELSESMKANAKPQPKKNRVTEFPSSANLLVQTLDWETEPYPYFNSVTWVDPDGLQRIKWTTRDVTTAFLDVSKRPYFTDARDGNLWKLNHAGEDFEYAFEPVNSKNTAENVAIFSTRMPNSKWVSIIDTKLSSLLGTVLPSGYGFAVVDNTGKVMFHSDEVNNLQERFFEECDNDRSLRAAVLARSSQFINAQYLGKGNRMYVSPMPGTPWMIVVFRDKQMARTINLEVLTLALILYLVFAIVALLVVSIVYLPRRGERIRRLWPKERNARQYDLLIVINAIHIFAFLIVSWTAKSDALLLSCCYLLPSVATVVGAIILKDRPTGYGDCDSSDPERLPLLSWLPYRKSYAVALVGSLALMSILPALGFFQIAANFEMRLMVKHGQVSLARGIERRNARVTAQYESIKIGPNDQHKKAFLARRLDLNSAVETRDLYDSFFFGTLHTGPAVETGSFVPEQPGKVTSALAELRPLYNQSCVESQELSRSGSADGVWSWEQDGGSQLRMRKGKVGQEGQMSVALVSTLPPFAAPDSPAKWLVAILGLAGLCCLVYQLVCFVARNFFLLDQDSPRPLARVLTHVAPTKNVAIVRPPTPINGNLWDLSTYHRIDLSQVSGWEGWAQRINAPAPPAGLTVVLDHFDHDRDDPAANREKLRVLEQFLSESRRVIVVSAVDPLRFSIQSDPASPNASSNGDASKAHQTKAERKGEEKADADVSVTQTVPEDRSAASARWSIALSTFVTVYNPDYAGPDFVSTNTEFVGDLKASRPWRYIETIGKQIAGNGAGREQKADDYCAREEKVNEVVDQARPYHQALWTTCSKDERCTLIHLALDGMVSSKNTDLRQLMKRGLVVRDPGLRLMDESFRRFVMSVSQKEDIHAWRQAGGSNWELLKTPLMLILLSIAVFLFVTQKEVYDSSISFVSALTAGLTGLFKLFGLFNKKGGTAIDV